MGMPDVQNMFVEKKRQTACLFGLDAPLVNPNAACKVETPPTLTSVATTWGPDKKDI